MEEIKPIKRSEALAPLSREHHDGLLYAWKIKQGLANQTPLETMCNYTRWFWVNHLQPHFKDEEEVLAKWLPADHPMVRQMFEDHTRIRNLVLSLDREPDEGSLTLLAEFLHHHIRFEERELFALAEELLTPGQRDSLAKDLSHEHSCDTAWTDEFWVRK